MEDSKSASCRETPGTGRSDGWRAKAKKEKDRLRKRMERMCKGHPQEGGAPDKCCKGVGNRGKIRGVKSKRLQRKDAMRNYTIKKAPGATLQYNHREILQKDRNDRIENGRMPTLRAFARDHGLAVQTWKTGMQRKACGSHPPKFSCALHKCKRSPSRSTIPPEKYSGCFLLGKIGILRKRNPNAAGFVSVHMGIRTRTLRPSRAICRFESVSRRFCTRDGSGATASPFRRNGITVPAQRGGRSGATASPFRRDKVPFPSSTRLINSEGRQRLP